MEHASEVWWTGGKAACMNMEKKSREHWQETVGCRGYGKWGPGLEEVGGEKGRK